MFFRHKNSQNKQIIAFIGIALTILSLGAPVLYLMKEGVVATLILFSYAMYILFVVLNGKKIEKNKQQAFEDWKSEAKKILVGLENYEIKSNSWTDEIEIKQDWRLQAFNQMTGNSDRNIKKIARNPNYVRLILDLEGEVYHHDFYIDKDTQNLKILLGLKQETWVYIDKNDPTKKYVDLEFLQR